MPNTPPIQIDERLVTTAPTDVQATQADVLNYAEFLAQILEQHYRQYHRSVFHIKYIVCKAHQIET